MLERITFHNKGYNYSIGLESKSFSVLNGILSQKLAQVCKTSIQILLLIVLLE